MPSSNFLLACVCVAACLTNTFVLVKLLSRPEIQILQARDAEYSYLGDDHPLYTIDLDAFPRVALDVEESVHYGLGPSAFADWETFPLEEVMFRLGLQYRVFVTANSHIRHCMIRLHRVLYPQMSEESMTLGHVQHCLNFMRQMILCNADLTLEPPDALDACRSGYTHVCRDWRVARALAWDLTDRWAARFNLSTERSGTDTLGSVLG